MANVLLSAKGIKIRFGGVIAADGIDLDVYEGENLAIIQQIATPEFGFWTKSGEFVFIAVLGGSAHAFGAFAGAAMFECVRFYAAAHLVDSWQLILGVVLIVIILYAPNGLIGLRQRYGQAKPGGY